MPINTYVVVATRMRFSSSLSLASKLAGARTPPLPKKYNSALVRENFLSFCSHHRGLSEKILNHRLPLILSSMSWIRMKSVAVACKVFLITLTPTASSWELTLEAGSLECLHVCFASRNVLKLNAWERPDEPSNGIPIRSKSILL